MTRLIFAILLSLLLPVQSWAAVAGAAAGTPSGGTTSLSLALPASVADGDLLVLCIFNKYPTNAPSTPTGYTAPSNNKGTGDPGDGPGVDLGATYATIFYKVASSESGNVSVTITSGNSAYGVIMRFTNATGAWLVAAANGGDSSSGTAWSAQMGTDPDIQGGDMVAACSGKNNDSASGTSEALTTTGVTYGAATERADNGTTFGDDGGIIASDHAVTSGSSAGNLTTVTWTAAANTAGGTAILRVREDSGAPATATQSGSGFLGTIMK